MINILYDDEIFKIIDGFDNYSVSNYGRIYSNISNKFLKFTYDKDGYYKACIYNMHKQYTYRVHRIVAKTFILNPNPIEYTIINHINGIRDDNRVCNLEWCNNSINQLHRFHVMNNGYEHEKYAHNFKNVNAYFINEDNSIMKIIKFSSVNDCARYFRLSGSAIWNRLANRTPNPSIKPSNNLYNIYITFDNIEPQETIPLGIVHIPLGVGL